MPTIAAAIAQQPKRTTLELEELGRQRFAILESLGLANSEFLDRRTAELTDDDLETLRYGFLDISKCTLDSLLELAASPEPPTAIWVGTSPPQAMLGATLLWADHYLGVDELTESLCRHERPPTLSSEIRALLELRPLIEVGLIVPVLHGAATVIAAEQARLQTELDLARPELVEWVMDQLIMEGPTATTALLFTVLDDDEELVNFFLHGRIIGLDDEKRQVTNRLLGPYDPEFDYGPWIAQSRRQTVAGILQEANLQQTMADAFASSWVTLSPFKARLLERRSGDIPFPQSLVWAEVPHLKRSSAVALAKVASDDVAVRALRERTRQVFATMRTASPEERRLQADDLAVELRNASDRLRGSLDRDRRWKLALPVAATVASVAVGTIMGGPDVGTISGLLSAAAGLSPLIADRGAKHDDPAFALLLGDGLVESRPLPEAPAGTLNDLKFPIDIIATEIGNG